MKTKPIIKYVTQLSHGHDPDWEVPFCNLKSGTHVILALKNHEDFLTTTALASACCLHSLLFTALCVGGQDNSLLKNVLGEENVITLPENSPIKARTKAIKDALEMARTYGHILLLDVMVDRSFDVNKLIKEMPLLRCDTLSIVISWDGVNLVSQHIEEIWENQPNCCVIHDHGSNPNDNQDIKYQALMDNFPSWSSDFRWENLPVWKSGGLTHEALDILNRRGKYNALPTIPDLLRTVWQMQPAETLLIDPNLSKVFGMLFDGNRHIEEHIFKTFVIS